jgi:hypothetical protein
MFSAHFVGNKTSGKLSFFCSPSSQESSGLSISTVMPGALKSRSNQIFFHQYFILQTLEQ